MIPQSEFHAVLKAVAHSAGTNDRRENLNSILFEFLGDECRLVSTDGCRITIAVLSTPEIGTGNFLAPIEDIKELLSMFKHKSDKRVSFTVKGGLLTVTNGRATLSLERLDTEYPDYRRVLPVGDICSASIDCFNAKYIAQAVRACAGLINSVEALSIIKRGETIPMTLRPVLDTDIEIVKSLEVHIMPMRRAYAH